MTRLFNLFVIVFVIGLGTEVRAAEPTVETKIVGGLPVTSASTYRWMVLLSSSDQSNGSNPAYPLQPGIPGFFCGATLISDKWVLTAAHCVVDASVDSLYAFVGEYDKTTADITANPVTKIIVHPDYNANTSDNDIALLRLKNPETGIVPINIITPMVAAQLETLSGNIDNDVTALGWGETEDLYLGSSPDILREVSLPYIDNDTCNDSMALNGQVTPNMMCAGLPQGGVDSCQGDSGGPLIFSDAGQWYQAGIVSWGIGCADANKYGVYTRVEKYIGWIEKSVTITPFIDFSTWVSGKTVSAQIEIDNATDASFTISVSSSDDTVFQVGSNTCNDPIAIGETCAININFIASIVGDYTGAITIMTNHPSLGTIDVTVNGKIALPTSFNLVEVDTNLNLVLGGDNDWYEADVTATGYALQSGDITDNQSTSVFTYVTVPASGTRELFFDWKSCSEPDYDYLQLWVDNVKKDAISGDTDWYRKTLLIEGEGDHVIEWRYNKDYACSSGNDAGWIDNISLDAPINNVPVHSTSCNIKNIQPLQPPCAPAPTSGGGGALSGWFYLGLGLPLLARRRRQIQ